MRQPSIEHLQRTTRSNLIHTSQPPNFSRLKSSILHIYTEELPQDLHSNTIFVVLSKTQIEVWAARPLDGYLLINHMNRFYIQFSKRRIRCCIIVSMEKLDHNDHNDIPLQHKTLGVGILTLNKLQECLFLLFRMRSILIMLAHLSLLYSG